MTRAAARAFVSGLLVVVVSGCGGGAATSTPDGGGSTGAAGGGGPDGGTVGTPDGGATSDAGGSGILALPGCAIANRGACLQPLARTRADVCGRYVADRVDRTINVFTPGASACAAGTTTPTAIQATLKRINLYRWLVGVPAITLDAATSDAATACAVITAHRPEFATDQPVDLHHPPATTPCYTQAGADGALTSLVDPEGDHPTDGIDAMMYDFGGPNRGVLGHRRALLHPWLTAAGLGYSRDFARGFGAMCAKLAPYGDFAPQTALDGLSMYPAPDVFPWDALVFSNVDEVMSWHVVVPAILDFAGAQVSMFVEAAGGRQPVEVTSDTAGGTGETTLWMRPKETPPRDATIVVEVANLPVGPVGYRVVLADCGTVPPEPQKTKQGGPCAVTYQDCVTPGYTCEQIVGDPFAGTCVPAGSFAVGTPCFGSGSCVAGTGCVAGPTGQGVCGTFCDFGTDAVRPCDTVCGAKGYTPIWSVNDLDGKPFGNAVCKI